MNDGRASKEVNEAWDALHEAVPARWHVGRPSYDPGRQAWSVTAWGPHLGRGESPPSITGTGETETAALRDLDAQLRGVPRANRGRMDELRRRLRMAYMDGAEALSWETLDRGLTRDELGRIIERYEGR